MPAERIAMRQVRDVLRLKTAGVAINEIARRVGVASSTVRLTLKRLAAAGLGWPLPPEMTDTALEEQLFTAVGKKQGHRRLAEPDWAAVHRELKRKHVLSLKDAGVPSFFDRVKKLCFAAPIAAAEAEHRERPT